MIDSSENRCTAESDQVLRSFSQKLQNINNLSRTVISQSINVTYSDQNQANSCSNNDRSCQDNDKFCQDSDKSCLDKERSCSYNDNSCSQKDGSCSYEENFQIQCRKTPYPHKLIARNLKPELRKQRTGREDKQNIPVNFNQASNLQNYFTKHQRVGQALRQRPINLEFEISNQNQEYIKHSIRKELSDRSLQIDLQSQQFIQNLASSNFYGQSNCYGSSGPENEVMHESYIQASKDCKTEEENLLNDERQFHQTVQLEQDTLSSVISLKYDHEELQYNLTEEDEQNQNNISEEGIKVLSELKGELNSVMRPNSSDIPRHLIFKAQNSSDSQLISFKTQNSSDSQLMSFKTQNNSDSRLHQRQNAQPHPITQDQKDNGNCKIWPLQDKQKNIQKSKQGPYQCTTVEINGSFVFEMLNSGVCDKVEAKLKELQSNLLLLEQKINVSLLRKNHFQGIESKQASSREIVIKQPQIYFQFQNQNWRSNRNNLHQNDKYCCLNQKNCNQLSANVSQNEKKQQEFYSGQEQSESQESFQKKLIYPDSKVVFSPANQQYVQFDQELSRILNQPRKQKALSLSVSGQKSSSDSKYQSQERKVAYKRSFSRDLQSRDLQCQIHYCLDSCLEEQSILSTQTLQIDQSSKDELRQDDYLMFKRISSAEKKSLMKFQLEKDVFKLCLQRNFTKQSQFQRDNSFTRNKLQESNISISSNDAALKQINLKFNNRFNALFQQN